MSKQENVALQVRLPKEERQAFVDACDKNDTTASREVRRFIREYLKKNAQGKLSL